MSIPIPPFLFLRISEKSCRSLFILHQKNKNFHHVSFLLSLFWKKKSLKNLCRCVTIPLSAARIVDYPRAVVAAGLNKNYREDNMLTQEEKQGGANRPFDRPYPLSYGTPKDPQEGSSFPSRPFEDGRPSPPFAHLSLQQGHRALPRHNREIKSSQVILLARFSPRFSAGFFGKNNRIKIISRKNVKKWRFLPKTARFI